jgi:hypothetical protein
MDEKRFDVDGTYNARYEVVKTYWQSQHQRNNGKNYWKEKITIVYSQIMKKQNT